MVFYKSSILLQELPPDPPEALLSTSRSSKQIESSDHKHLVGLREGINGIRRRKY